jgi:hypothetical protein
VCSMCAFSIRRSPAFSVTSYRPPRGGAGRTDVPRRPRGHPYVTAFGRQHDTSIGIVSNSSVRFPGRKAEHASLSRECEPPTASSRRRTRRPGALPHRAAVSPRAPRGQSHCAKRSTMAHRWIASRIRWAPLRRFLAPPASERERQAIQRHGSDWEAPATPTSAAPNREPLTEGIPDGQAVERSERLLPSIHPAGYPSATAAARLSSHGRQLCGHARSSASMTCCAARSSEWALGAVYSR